MTIYSYVVNGKNVIEWIMERYAITIHEESGITNAPPKKTLGCRTHQSSLHPRPSIQCIDSIEIIKLTEKNLLNY
mgnify:CR=1 FL=1